MKLRVENLMKSYNGRKVVKDVSLEVNQGEIVGLLGPNGAGKTTSFYMAVGLIKPNGGAIYLDDKEITSYPMYKRAQSGIGYLAQEASVFRKLSIEDNILSVLQMTKLSKKEQVEKMESLINSSAGFNFSKPTLMSSQYLTTNLTTVKIPAPMNAFFKISKKPPLILVASLPSLAFSSASA